MKQNKIDPKVTKIRPKFKLNFNQIGKEMEPKLKKMNQR